MMKKLILLLFFIPLGCSVETKAIEDHPTTIQDSPNLLEDKIAKDCPSEPLLDMYEDFVELGIKSANLTTEKASITYSKHLISNKDAREKLISEFGIDFLKNVCAFDGLMFITKDKRESYLGAYQITFNSSENAGIAAEALGNLNREHFRTNKVATLFDWKLNGAAILITYNAPSVTAYYDHNVREFSK